ncbi:hypothetical protein R5H30_11630 [Sulfitobacter sp. D35]|uniref:hypothetical protein n=1 Tax=Sulfitobacter sp. D35 TaxID=3083252 RepID=UPI00296EDCDD|nr:hypothetical protein [Sulfitobacter sp. D35]MDW4498635.1 hypothetical protein [Sulfitobacter sp. D35]
MLMPRKAGLAGLAFLLALPAAAADFSDPEWPCVQRKVESLSLGLMWASEIAEEGLPDDRAGAGAELVETLILRRIPVEEIPVRVDAFIAAHPDVGDAELGSLFEAAFTRVNRERTRLVKGITRYSLAQIEAAKRIDAARTEMDRLMAMDDPDYDRVDALEEQIDWDERIYRDRQQSLTYVCETPVLMEKRLFAIAQALSAHLSG